MTRQSRIRWGSTCSQSTIFTSMFWGIWNRSFAARASHSKNVKFTGTKNKHRPSFKYLFFDIGCSTFYELPDWFLGGCPRAEKSFLWRFCHFRLRQEEKQKERREIRRFWIRISLLEEINDWGEIQRSNIPRGGLNRQGKDIRKAWAWGGKQQDGSRTKWRKIKHRDKEGGQGGRIRRIRWPCGLRGFQKESWG